MLVLGAKEAQGSATGKCAMIWLILAFFFHTTGELCLSPVGLSTITKLSPARLVGMFMGVWFLSSALGNVLAPWVAGSAEGLDFSVVFQRIAVITAGGGGVLLLLVPLLKRMMHGVK
jgi:POT family proton-dependent oligopeptide transporter